MVVVCSLIFSCSFSISWSKFMKLLSNIIISMSECSMCKIINSITWCRWCSELSASPSPSSGSIRWCRATVAWSCPHTFSAFASYSSLRGCDFPPCDPVDLEWSAAYRSIRCATRSLFYSLLFYVSPLSHIRCFWMSPEFHNSLNLSLAKTIFLSPLRMPGLN